MKSKVKYYDYRKDLSERIQQFERNWFENKSCLDIGCSSGILTIHIAKLFNPRMIEGIDSMEDVIREANIKLLNETNSTSTTSSTITSITSFIPRSIKCSTPRLTFPNNCHFHVENILDLSNTTNQKQFDTILCLNVTKWIHLNYGDAGLMKLFWNIWELLKCNGLLIIEYQPWLSYVKNRNTSTQTKEIFPTIQIKPENFESLLVNEIGFEIVENRGTPLEEAKGFNRPILILRKPINKNYTRLEYEIMLNCLKSQNNEISIENNETNNEIIEVDIIEEKDKNKKKSKSKSKSKKKKRKVSNIEEENPENLVVIESNNEMSESIEKRNKSSLSSNLNKRVNYGEVPTQEEWFEIVNNSIQNGNKLESSQSKSSPKKRKKEKKLDS